MATLISSDWSNSGSPKCRHRFYLEEKSRSENKITLEITVKSNLQYEASYLLNPYKLNAGIYIDGSWYNFDIKTSSEYWEGTAVHTKTVTKTFTVNADITKLSGIKVRVRRTDNLGDACALTAKTADTSTFSIADSAKFTITYDANGGIGAPESQIKNYGETITLSTITPTRAPITENDKVTEYYFQGWAIGNSTEVSYDPGSSYSNNSSVTLKAIWSNEARSYFNITYNILVFGHNSTTIEKKLINIAYVIEEAPSIFGYDFNHWIDSSTGQIYQPGDEYTINANLELQGVFTPWSHSVSYNLNGGNSSVTLSSFTKTIENICVIEETEPVKNGYVFKYWNTATDGSGTSFHSGQAYTIVQKDTPVILYAIWMEDSIEIYNCRAIQFIETTEMLGFTSGSQVLANEFIEGSSTSISSNGNMYFNEIIEK